MSPGRNDNIKTTIVEAALFMGRFKPREGKSVEDCVHR